MENNKGNIKCVVVGNGVAGKTALLYSFIENKFPQEYVPINLENVVQNITVNGEEIQLNLRDTPGAEAYERLRPLSYPNTNVFLVCFSVVNHSSFENVKSSWIPEIQYHCPDTPFLLVGLKTDLRTDKYTIERLKEKNEEPISFKEGVKLARKIKAVKYVECSALTQTGVRDVFTEAACAAIKGRSPQHQKCTLS